MPIAFKVILFRVSAAFVHFREFLGMKLENESFRQDKFGMYHKGDNEELNVLLTVVNDLLSLFFRGMLPKGIIVERTREEQHID